MKPASAKQELSRVQFCTHFRERDTLFDGGPGKTWSVHGFMQTLKTLRDVVLSWPDETICRPGHGLHFKLGPKRAEIERFLRKNHGHFYGDAQWGM